MKTRPSINSEFNQCQKRIRIKFWIKFNLINHVTSNMQFQCHPSILRILTTKLCTNNLTRRHSALNRKYSQVLIIIPLRWPLDDLRWPPRREYGLIVAHPNRIYKLFRNLLVTKLSWTNGHNVKTDFKIIKIHFGSNQSNINQLFKVNINPRRKA